MKGSVINNHLRSNRFSWVEFNNSIYPVGLLGFALLNPTYKGDSKDQLPRSIAQSTNRLGFVPQAN